MKQILEIDIGEECIETMPCTHDCVIRYHDGTSVEIELDGYQIKSNDYWPFLSNRDKEHFQDAEIDDANNHNDDDTMEDEDVETN